MMNTLYYLLEANIYLAVFYGFYRLFLHRETFYTLNRYYLIAATVLSFALPLLQLGYLHNLTGPDHTEQAGNEITKISMQPGPGLNLAVYSYMAIALFFLGRFLINLVRVVQQALQNPRFRKGKVVYIALPGPETAFSFFNLLFIHPAASDKNTIIRHEMVHIQQKHSADVIFFEMVRILGWFNPITHLLRKDIKLLHEYIADDLTTCSVRKHDYAMFLIQNSFGVMPNQLGHQIFNQSILKMRINMLNKKRSAGPARLRFLLALPLAGGMLCASTMAFTKDYATVDLYPKQRSFVAVPVQDTLKKSKKVAVRKMADAGKKNAEGEKVKFRPPIVVKNAAPASPPKKKGTKIAKERVKFPPPIVKPAGVPAGGKIKEVRVKDIPPPPPPVEPKPAEEPKNPIKIN